MASATARRDHIVSALRSAGFLSVTDLARDFGVSDMTVRRDLRKLADDGQVRIVHGGASLPGFLHRADTNTAAKRRIAKEAVRLLAPRDTVAIDAGTTTYELAGALTEDFTGCVVTHSVPVIQHLLARQDVRLVGLGGDLYRASQAFVGPRTVDATEGLRLRTFFLGASAVDDRGVYVASDIERPTKQALMDIADNVVLLVDSTKFTTSSPVQLCALDRLHTVITDRTPRPPVTERLRHWNVNLIVCAAD